MRLPPCYEHGPLGTTAVHEGPPVLLDWRLRECDYGELNGAPRERVHGRRVEHLTRPYAGGESWQQAVERVGGALEDVRVRWEGGRVLLVGHVATRLALDHLLDGVPLTDALEAEFVWRPGWEYVLGPGPLTPRRPAPG